MLAGQHSDSLSAVPLGTKFPNYNIREYAPIHILLRSTPLLHSSAARGNESLSLYRYVKRKAKQDFRKHKDETDKLIINDYWRKALEAMEVVQRQAVVYKLYARKHKSIMVRPRTVTERHFQFLN